MTLAGAIAWLILRALGYAPGRWCGTTYFVVGKDWGGISLGPVTLTSDPGEHMLTHEFGHSIQNCRWGILYLPVILLPSLLRYWYRRTVLRVGFRRKDQLSGYYDIWFESRADRLGREAVPYWAEKA